MIPPRLLTDGLVRAAASAPDKVAVLDEFSNCSYGQLLERASHLAEMLRGIGLTKGDRVVIYLDNSVRCAVAIYGVMLAGCVVVVVNPQTKSDKLRFILEDSGAAALIADQHLKISYEAAMAGLSAVRLIISDAARPRADDFLMAAEPPATARAWPKSSSMAPAIPCDLAALIYTSGSTGTSKAVMQTHQSMVFAAWSIIDYLQLSANDRILLFLPMAFDYGMYQLFMSVFIGATLYIERSFAFFGRIHAVMNEAAITVVPGIPTAFSMMKTLYQRAAVAYPQVRIVTNTAAALSPSLIPSVREIFPNARIFKMYGLTECKRVSYLDPELLATHPESVGRAIPGTEVFLRSPTGEPVPPNSPGILHVRGPHVMVGYWNRPELTMEMLTDGPVPGERVLNTHDWFVQDAEGLLYFLGRSDDIIKTRGEKVSPREVEEVIHRLSEVSDVAVVGVADLVLGESIQAYLVTGEDSALTEQDVRRFCSLHLESHMVPQRVHFLPELPRTPNGKVDKSLLSRGGR